MLTNIQKEFLGNKPNFTTGQNIRHKIQFALSSSVKWFQLALSQTYSKRLNERELTQEFVSILNRQFIDLAYPFVAQVEYIDIHTPSANTKKTVDFAIISSEQGAVTKSLYSIEAKRLPTGTGKREQEYVCGYFPNGTPSGGIQRFKTKDHGAGLCECALLGYVEENDFDYWINLINNWIKENANNNNNQWSTNEQIEKLEKHITDKYSISSSIIQREKDTLNLLHFWVDITDYTTLFNK